jgi:hypothetical protein
MSASDNEQGRDHPGTGAPPGPGRAGPDEEVDEELLTLAPPPPGLRHAVLIVSFLILSGFMLYWFSPELRYLLQGIGGPVDLGDSPEIDVDELESHTFASADGIPMVNRTLVYNEAMKWFAMSDTERKMFPLSGNPGFYVQWSPPDSHKAYGANPPLPSHFEGHLIDRTELGPNFDKVWIFFDCLEVHPINRCKFCLGRNSAEDCRAAFTCVERNGPDECGRILERSRESLEAQIGAGDDEARARELLAALREQEIAVAGVRLEELATRARGLYPTGPDAAAGKVDELRAAVLRLRAKELQIRGSRLTKAVGAMDDRARAAAAGSVARLALLVGEEEPAKVSLLKTLRSFVEIGGELERLKRRARWVRTRVAEAESAEAIGMSPWTLDLATADGEAVLRALGDMEALLFHREDRGAADAGTAADDVDAGIALDGVTPQTISDPGLWKVFESFGALETRAGALQRKVARVLPGEVAAFDDWARKTNTVLQLCRSSSEEDCKMPEGLRSDEVVASLGRLEEMLAPVPLDEEGRAPLADRMSREIDALDLIRDEIEELGAMAGLRELTVSESLAALGPKVEGARTRSELDEAEEAIERVRGLMLEKGLLPVQFRGMPDELEALEEALAPATVADLEARAAALADARGRRTFVLVDGELPIDKLWVAVVYLLLVIMIAVNIRKLWRFWVAWRA